MRVSIVVGGLSESAPETTVTRHRAQIPMPPQELPRGAPTLRATSRMVSSGRAVPLRPSGTKVTTADAPFTAVFPFIEKLQSLPDVYYSRTMEGHMIGRSEEARLAHRIVGVLPGGDVVRVLCEDADTIRFAVNDPGSKLRSVVFSRLSLRRLLADAARDVKVEYLQRDLLTSATRRAEYRYPRVDRIVAAVRNLRKRKQSLVRAAALASVL